MGRNHVRVYSEMRETDQIYVYDVKENTAREVADQNDAVVCSSLESLYRKVDAVSICVPTAHHLIHARLAMDNEVHCLIEKPITSSSAEGFRLLKMLNRDLVVGVGHIERFNPVSTEIKNLLINPRYIDIRRHNPASTRIKDANVVIDLMIHDIDLVWNHFFSDCIDFKIYSAGDNNLRKIVAGFGECLVSLSASRISCNKIRTIHVEEDDFTIDGDFMTQEVYIHRKPEMYGENNTRYAQENIIEKVLINRVEPLKEELKTFINCIKQGKPFPIMPEQAVLNLMIAESSGLNIYSAESPLVVPVTSKWY